MMSYFWNSKSKEEKPQQNARGHPSSSRGSYEPMDFEDHHSSGPRYPQRKNTTSRNLHQSPYDPHMDHYTGYAHGYSDKQMVTQEQAFRSAQASKQMVYEVYGNVISILEEFEQREMKLLDRRVESLPKSNIYIPDQSKKKDHDVRRIVETQLLLFQTHLHSACRPEIRDEVLEELKKATKKWMAVRKDRQLPRGDTDKYAAQLYEILSKGKTQHPNIFMQSPNIDERELPMAAQQYFEGDHRRAQLDADFAKDPNKKATFPAVRSGTSADTGLDRLAESRPDLVDNMNTPSNYR